MFKSSKLIRQGLLPVILLISCLGLFSVIAAAQSLSEERIIEDKVPTHLPIKFKIKNLSKVKDLKNRHWLRDLELEVKNTGDRPIYHFIIAVFMPEVLSPSGIPFGYPLTFGRHVMHDPSEKAIPEDVPLEPGESCILKFPEQDWRGWEAATASGDAVDPKKVRLIFGGLSFGDGTGFRSTEGHPYPRKVSSCYPHRKNGEVGASTSDDLGISRYPFLQLTSSFAPVNFLPANFQPLARSNSISTEKPSSYDVCCP